VIRRATVADAKAVAHVHRSARAEAPHPRHVTDEEWRERLDRGDLTTFVWEDRGAVLGIAGVLGDQLAVLYVLPGAQGQGIGSALLSVAVEHGARRLAVYADNDGGRRFYERHGWVLEDEDDEEARYRRG
jgi:GNAT superfamily N-acetyltransferase